MWEMNRALSRRRHLAALGLAALLAASVWAPAASAGPAIGKARALTQPTAATSTQSAAMSIDFTSPTARVVGPGALVSVRCAGTSATSCVGTLAIEAPGEQPPEVAYSVDRGEERAIVVPLGEQRTFFDGIVAVRTRVVAETVQAEGGAVRSVRTLRFK
jgi:hypothetical protein